MGERRRSWWGWGWEDQAVSDDAAEVVAAVLGAQFDRSVEVRPSPDLDQVSLRAPRIKPPAALDSIVSSDTRSRALHTYGRAYRDVVRAFHLEFDSPPDLVVMPRHEADVVAVLDWCADARVACVPFGGGSSVVGGVECDPGDGFRGVVTMDMTRMDRVLEVEPVSRAARIQAGALGPVLEDQLRPDGLTLRHFPQSFEFSTLGGWLATRAGGHYATVYTHIDDLVESMRVVTPTGVSESRRLPGSGAGPSHDRLFLGSEGSLGVITEAWMRLQERPRWKCSTSVRFARFHEGVDAVRDLSQSALFPTNCRLLDSGEAALNAGAPGLGALLVLGFESADHPVDADLTRAIEICREHGGEADEPRSTDSMDPSTAARVGAVEAWRSSFLQAPYLRDAMVRCGFLAETFETACTWDRFATLHSDVTGAVEAALRELCGGGGITCRFTHVYPDGPAPYFTVVAPTRFGSEVAIWDEVKAAASEAILTAGGTITHHHAVGRDHLPWYTSQRTEVLGRALRAAKSELDPEGVLNPGVIVDAE